MQQHERLKFKEEGLGFYKEKARANAKSRTNELMEMKKQIKILTDKLLKKEEETTDYTYNLKEADLEKPTVVDYLVVCDYSTKPSYPGGLKRLTSQVIKYTKLGWVVLGGVSNARDQFSQAMVLYSK